MHRDRQITFVNLVVNWFLHFYINHFICIHQIKALIKVETFEPLTNFLSSLKKAVELRYVYVHVWTLKHHDLSKNQDDAIPPINYL